MNRPIAWLPESMRPVDVPLVRVGSAYDGGYLIAPQSIEAATHVLSFGLDTNWAFEADFAERKKNDPQFSGIDAWDPTLNQWLLVKRTVRHVGRRLRGKRISNMGTWQSYRKMFGNPRINHHRHWIGNRSCPDTADFRQCLSKLPDTAQVFLKMDIEGSEYEILQQIVEHGSCLTGIAMELHDVDRRLESASHALDALAEQFHIVHVHANNHAGSSADGCPEVIEVSLVHRRLAPAVVSHVAGMPHHLDRPNKPSRPEFEIRFRPNQPGTRAAA